MTRRSFNTSIEGQPLQHGYKKDIEGVNIPFQSLYRGTAFATESLQKP